MEVEVDDDFKDQVLLDSPIFQFIVGAREELRLEILVRASHATQWLREVIASTSCIWFYGRLLSISIVMTLFMTRYQVERAQEISLPAINLGDTSFSPQ
jgi:hypothetical protein